MKSPLALVWLFSAAFAVQDFPALNHIRPSASPEDQRQAVQALIERVLGDNSSHFIVRSISPSIGPPYKDTFIIESDGETVNIAATSGVAAAMGFYHFIKTKCNCLYTWAGAQLKLPHPLPVIPSPGIKVTSNDRFRYYQNVCTVSYSMVWWDWARWEREIDWMAMNGINLPLAFTGQEAIFQRVYMSLGLSREDLKTHWGGPAFLAWARMGNMHGWGGPLPQLWIDSQLALQHKILARMRDLGMIPVLPGFAGHVPQALIKYYPNASISHLGDWGRFNQTYCCTYLLDFEDPLFQKIGSSFIQEMQREFGVDHVYNADSFNEMEPRSGDPSYLKEAGGYVYKAMVTADPQAIWLMQGWLFLDQKFWKPSRIEALLTSVPQGKMIVLDLSADSRPIYSQTNSFYGQPFIWCLLHNFGGALELVGNFKSINEGPFAARTFANSTMIGTGLTPEGINQNEAVYEFMNENAIAQAPRNITQWFIDFAVSRYGGYFDSTVAAWQNLMKSVYSSTTGLSDSYRNEVVILRPSLTLTEQVWYDRYYLLVALEFLTKACTDQPCVQLLKYDLIDVLRNAHQLVILNTFQNIVKAYRDKDISTLQSEGSYLLEVLQSLESALATDSHFLLGSWIADARNHGNTNEAKDLMEYNARNQVTLWGPLGEIHDYAGKQWSGLVEKFYSPRWKLFVDMLSDAVQKGVAFNQTLYDQTVFKTVEEPFTFSKQKFHTEPQGDPVTIAQTFLRTHSAEMRRRFKSLGGAQKLQI